MTSYRRPIIFILSLLGTFCLCAGVVMQIAAQDNADTEPDQSADQQTDATEGADEAQSVVLDAEYMGERECTDCHRDVGRFHDDTAHALTMLRADRHEDAILGVFDQGEEARLFEFPDEAGEERPFTVDDIAYVIGMGRVAQRYLYEDGDAYRVLPAEWVTLTGEWRRLELPNGDDWNANCAGCHTTGFDVDTGDWVDAAVMCEACHGPGSVHVEAADDAGGSIDEEEMAALQASIITVPNSQTCGQCHSQGMSAVGDYPYAVGFTPGADLSSVYHVAEADPDACTNADDLVHCANTEYNDWLHSAHGNDETIACTDCHTLHDEEGEVTLIAESEALCTTCHDNGPPQLLSGDPIVEQVNGTPSSHHSDGVVCMTCHTGHTWRSIPDDPDAPNACTTCHTDLTAAALNDFANDAQERVENRLMRLNGAISSNTPDWVNTIVETVEEDGSGGVHNYAYVSRLLDAAENELGLLSTEVLAGMPIVEPENPQDCAECHSDVHSIWQNSAHANASLSQSFQQEYASNGRPSYCMNCHASGYDPTDQTYVFEGVVCSSCHVSEGEHPPAPMPIADSSQACGRCHTGEHASEFDEWMVSQHSSLNVDCVDCHVAHDNSLRLGDVNTTCADCHANAMNDMIHMGEDMTCVDCHMTRIVDDAAGEPQHIIQHTMFMEPRACGECHGDIHTLQQNGDSLLSEEEFERIHLLEEEVATLENKADSNLQSGIVGGAIGSLVLVGFIFIALRLGRIQ